MAYDSEAWNFFKNNLPHHNLPYSKKNWGNINHSLCSYQGKLKPSIAYHLVQTFVPEGGRLFDPFSGVGTIPFEGALSGRESYGMDISIMAYYISLAKIGVTDILISRHYIDQISDYIAHHRVSKQMKERYANFGFNKKLADYYEDHTFNEILLARSFILSNPPQDSSEMVVVSSLLHILHGNRPYALSRRSHPIVPYAPTGEFVYKSLIAKLTEKVEKYYSEKLPNCFVEGHMYLQDSTHSWPDDVANLDSIITSPPFFDSTRFYSANWIRLWFCGWEPRDFEIKPQQYIDERQKTDMEVYSSILEQGRERIKNGGTFVFHLGKSNKCDMAEALSSLSRRWFANSEIFRENVEECATFGISDVGTVTEHEYLVLW